MENYNSLIKGLLRKRFVFLEAGPKNNTAPEAKKVSESGQARNLIRQKAINLLKDPNLKKEQRDALKKALDASTKTEVARDKVAASETAGELLNQLRKLGKGEDTFSAYEQKALGGEKGIEERDAKQEREAAKQLKMKEAATAKEGLPTLKAAYETKKTTAAGLAKSLTATYDGLKVQNDAYNLAQGTFDNWKGTDPMTDDVRTEMKFQVARMESAKVVITTLKSVLNGLVQAYEDAVTDCNRSATELSAKEDEIIGLEKEAGVTDGTKKTETPPFKTIKELPGQNAVSKSDVITGQTIPTIQSASPAPIAQRPNQGFGPKV